MPPNTDNNINTSSSAQGHSSMKSFTAKAEQFMKHTEQHALQGVNPGGIYLLYLHTQVTIQLTDMGYTSARKCISYRTRKKIQSNS